jgi:hypothetical protein
MKNKESKQQSSRTTGNKNKDGKAGTTKNATNGKAQKKGDTKAESVARNTDTDQE